LGGALLNKNNQNKQVSDFGIAKEGVSRVIRYIGATKIEEMMENEQYIEAFTHVQLGIEKILWDRIVEIFEGEKAIKVREAIDDYRRRKDRTHIQMGELIRWANFLGAIDDNENSDLIDFNSKRNNIIHGHGQWYHIETYKQALGKGIRFLNESGLV
jgi:hypothetical protein